MISYDFFGANYFGGDRIPYKLIRWWFLDCYYTYCQSKIHGAKDGDISWDAHELELDYAYEMLVDSFRHPIEKLMLDVLTLILIAGRRSNSECNFYLTRANEILKNYDLNSMLSSLPKEERKEFEHDLRLLRIL